MPVVAESGTKREHLSPFGGQTILLQAAARLIGDCQFEKLFVQKILDALLEVAGAVPVSGGEKMMKAKRTTDYRKSKCAKV